MKGWIRLGTIMSILWAAAVVVFSAIEFMSIPIDHCVKSAEGIPSQSIKLFFFWCDAYSDILANSRTWSYFPIRWDNQLVLFNTSRFLMVLLAPIGVSWLVSIAGYKAFRWVARGFKE